MAKNVGQPDRIIRIALGLVMIAAGLIAGSWWGLLGLIPLATGVIGICPLYAVLKLSTVKVPVRKKK